MDLEQTYKLIGILAGIVFLYTLIAKRVENSFISGPIVYVTIGLILGTKGFNVVGELTEANDLRFLADITLALILFSDAAHSNITVLKQKLFYPKRMLLIGLPGAILLGFAVAAVLFDVLSILEAAILGTILGATDAALGKAVITNQQVPAEIREGLNVESGLNDGLCVPVLLLLLAVATSHSHEALSTLETLAVFVEELGIGLIVGLSMAYLGATLLKWCAKNNGLSEVWIQLTVGAIALCCFGVTQTLHGSGYVASFSGGLLFGYLANKHTHELVLPTESIAELLAMLTWILFGAAVVGEIYGEFTISMLVYALLSLTLVRMLPIYLSYWGTNVAPTQRLFMGWFGPRGLASIVFTIILLDANLENGDFVALTVALTVLASLILHGITAKPFANLISRATKVR